MSKYSHLYIYRLYKGDKTIEEYNEYIVTDQIVHKPPQQWSYALQWIGRQKLQKILQLDFNKIVSNNRKREFQT